ncbi:MAG: lipopolysaccharide biosynthesis protein [Anaerolineales bacterium]|nr:lipopolysaccharide biosynthesis protein [Anaerolineales bacterium]
MMIKKTALVLLIILLLLALPASAYAVFNQESHAAQPAQPAELVRVYYAGAQDSLYTAIRLNSGFVPGGDLDQAQVIILNGTIPDPAAIRSRVQAGAGLALFCSPQTTAQDLLDLLGLPAETKPLEAPLSLVGIKGLDDPLLTQVVWNSAPQVRERLDILTPISSLTPVVVGFEDGAHILIKMEVGEGEAYIFTPFLGEYNPQFQEWAYFNYFVYHLVDRLAGHEPLSFADYPGSPVPHANDRLLLILLLAGLLSLSTVVFFFIRRFSLANPGLLDEIVANRQEFETRQEQTHWNNIGFHRALGGFMLALMLGLVLFIPLIVYQNLILPVYILPSAQALGIWGRVVQFFNFLWLFLDMGTSAAFIKFFAEYRVHDPRKAIQYGQIFVWWQALSGAIQVALVVALAGFMLPRTAYAIYTWSIIIHTFIQVPGFYQVMRNGLMAWQRFDYAQMLDLGLALIFPIIVQPVIVSLMVLWGKAHPIFGGATGGLLGLGLAAYAAEALTFFLGLWLYKRLGYNARLLFLAHFDWAAVKNAFRFGVFEMLGSFAWAIGQAMEILITQTRLVNYTEIWGNWGLAQNFIYAFNVLQTLFQNLMPSISESISNTRRALSQYYSVMAYKWGGLISAFVAAVLLAVADRFILGASGPEFVRAAAYSVPLIIWGAIQYPSWVGDTVQLGANRPYMKAGLVAGEQAIRILLAFLLVERYQINALIIAYFVGLFTKNIVAYILNHKLCFPQRFYFWQSLGAPLLAGGAHFLVLRWVTGYIWRGDQITSVLIFLIGILISYPLYAFFYGLFGGWDDDTLAELKQAAELSNFMRPLSRLFWSASALGARFSPLHGRFPIDIRDQALVEARGLTDERVEL